jgi:hypothetical protein
MQDGDDEERRRSRKEGRDAEDGKGIVREGEWWLRCLMWLSVPW